MALERKDGTSFVSGKSLRKFLAVVTLAAVVLGVMLAQRRAELAGLLLREASLKARIRTLRLQNAALHDERDRLLADVAAIEWVAREQYGFAAPGEMFTPFVERRKPCSAPTPVRVPISCDAWDGVLGKGGFPLILPLTVFMTSAVIFAALERIRAGRHGKWPQ